MIVCELCTDTVNVHIVSKCNHNAICSLCIIKLRLKTGNERCPFCNDQCDRIILTDKDEVEYEDLDLNAAIPYMGGLYFENQKVKEEVDEFNRIKCPINKCPDNTTYSNVNFLKKHIKEKHNRYFWYNYVKIQSKTCLVIFAWNTELWCLVSRDCLPVPNWTDI